MRFWIFSDLHLDVNASFGFQLPAVRPAHDAVIIAGDVCEGMTAAIDWIVREGLNAKPVIYVGGNHEFYGFDRYDGLQRGREAAARAANVHLLERDQIVLGDVTLLGATLWTSYDLYGTRAESMAIAERLMSDHRMIAHGGGAFSATSARTEHLASVTWLDTELRPLRQRAAKTIVVSHHAPTPRSISQRFQGHPLTASFTSDLEHLMPGVALWVHGHTHRVIDHHVGGCRVINNPRGYVRHEVTGFDGALVVDV
jgi:predicted phosphodiesterase